MSLTDKLKAAGIVPLAHGGQSWQESILFETVVAGIGGPEFFQKTLVEYDEASLKSDTMIKVFDQLRKLRGDVDPGVADVAGWLTPMPGGTGPMTIALLLRSAVKAARYRRGLLAYPTL